MEILLIITYLIGCISSYLIFKKMITNIDPKWTKTDRVAGLSICLFSWFTFIIVFLYLDDDDDDDDTASW